MARLLFFLVVAAVLWLLGSWSLMLTVGIAHLDWWHLVPVMSFQVADTITGVAVLFAVVTGAVGAFVRD